VAAAQLQTAVPALPSLDGDDVHVWFVDLEAARRVRPELLATLSAGEHERAGRFHFDRDRLQFSATRAVLRRLLAAYGGCEPLALEFTAGANGKPALAGTAPLAFNVSHSGSCAVVALSRRGELGVDIEAERPLDDRDALAAQFFSADESARLGALDPSLRDRAFFTCWSRKEAYVKAVGDGLSYPLDAFDVTFAPAEPARLSVPGDPPEAARWSLEALPASAGYAAALVTEGRRRVRCWKWELDPVEHYQEVV
jgi:4'-phosphopantetheinyl transferase